MSGHWKSSPKKGQALDRVTQTLSIENQFENAKKRFNKFIENEFEAPADWSFEDDKTEPKKKSYALFHFGSQIFEFESLERAKEELEFEVNIDFQLALEKNPTVTKEKFLKNYEIKEV